MSFEIFVRICLTRLAKSIEKLLLLSIRSRLYLVANLWYLVVSLFIKDVPCLSVFFLYFWWCVHFCKNNESSFKWWRVQNSGQTTQAKPTDPVWFSGSIWVVSVLSISYVSLGSDLGSVLILNFRPVETEITDLTYLWNIIYIKSKPNIS